MCTASCPPARLRLARRQAERRAAAQTSPSMSTSMSSTKVRLWTSPLGASGHAQSQRAGCHLCLPHDTFTGSYLCSATSDAYAQEELQHELHEGPRFLKLVTVHNLMWSAWRPHTLFVIAID